MNSVLIGNVVSLAGALFMIGVGFIRSRKKILAAQCFQFAIMGAGNLILGGTTGFIANLVSILRNLYCFRKPFTALPKVVFLLIQLSLSIGTMQWQTGPGAAGVFRFVIGWFPVLAALLYTWFLDVESASALKVVIIITQAMWLFYDFSLSNYAASVFDILTILSNLYGIYLLTHAGKSH